MSVRIQVIVEESEAQKFKTQARREGKSTSSWLRDAGKKEIEARKSKKPLKNPTTLKSLFDRINSVKEGREPEWAFSRVGRTKRSRSPVNRGNP